MDEKQDKPPYVAYSAFKSFLVRLKTQAIPPRIDRSMLKGMAGDAQTQMRAALRFMGAVTGEEFLVTDRLRTMVAAVDSDQWARVYAPIVQETYATLLGELDLQTGTAQQLEEKFREAGLNGSSRIRAIRFYLSALTDIGTAYSPFFRANVGKSLPSRSPASAKARRSKQKLAVEDVSDVGTPKPRSEGISEYALPLPGKPPIRLWLPEGLTAEEWNAVNAYLSAVLGLAKPTP